MKILLICSAGMSTSLVKKKIIDALGTQEKDWIITADSIERINRIIDDYDVILLGPQLAYKKTIVSEIANKKNKLFGVIDPMDYGVGNGANILKQIKELIDNQL